MGIECRLMWFADWILDGMADVCTKIGGRLVDWRKDGYGENR